MPAGTGRDVFERFRSGLADARCSTRTSQRWRQHYAGAATRLAKRDGQTLPVFAHVVDSLRSARLPTEYALIPFVESGYRPQARNPAGPAGLWQFVAPTARRLRIPMGTAGDGRLSPVESTRAAVEYLKLLHKRFGGDWRLAAMAYNAGEHRVAKALRSQKGAPGQTDPASLEGIPGSTRAYVEKLDALACVMDEASTRSEWLRALDRPVRRLDPRPGAALPGAPTIPGRS
ncbi:lytic transglycosylase domain-containing protein [Lysobacter korlensis]|uniref:Lytic transglycosylase domain-containing protein n=1 Tax=Lysobacter korlensis TaxID=553636 RepID=A0ABV6RKN5_9GAMM